MVGLFFLRKPKKQPPTPATTTPIEQPIDPPGEPGSDPDPSPTAAYRPLAPPLTLSPYSDEPPDGLPGVPDLYAILGLDPLCSDDVIRYTYRRRAAGLHERAWRPGQAVRQLAELNAAYEILGNPHRRADYDRRRARWAALEASLRAMGEDGRPSSNGRGLPSGRRHGRRRLRLARPGGLVEVIVIALVICLALYAAVTVLTTRSLVDLSWVVEAGESLGVSARRRPANGATPTPAPAPTPAPTPARQALTAPPNVPLVMIADEWIPRRTASAPSRASLTPTPRSALVLSERERGL